MVKFFRYKFSPGQNQIKSRLGQVFCIRYSFTSPGDGSKHIEAESALKRDLKI